MRDGTRTGIASNLNQTLILIGSALNDYLPNSKTQLARSREDLGHLIGDVTAFEAQWRILEIQAYPVYLGSDVQEAVEGGRGGL